MKRGTALAAVVALVTSAALAGSQAGAATSVRVTMTDFEFALAKSSVRKGAVTFKLVNQGEVRHDMRIGGKKSANIRPGGSGTLKVTLSRAGRYPYVCTLPGHAEAGMRGTLTVR